jgi:hypothetical protein
MRFEKRKGQKEEKWKKSEKKHSLQFGKTYFLYSSLLAGPLALHFQHHL